MDHHSPPDEASLSARSRQVLHEIAQALGVPAEAFLEARVAPAETISCDEPPTDEECAELVAAFRRIGNPRLRRRYLSLLHALARR